jgi:hypothetical protein
MTPVNRRRSSSLWVGLAIAVLGLLVASSYARGSHRRAAER